MAQLVTANPKLFSKSTDQELSESVVKVSGNSKFTRLDVREQWGASIKYNFGAGQKKGYTYVDNFGAGQENCGCKCTHCTHKFGALAYEYVYAYIFSTYLEIVILFTLSSSDAKDSSVNDKSPNTFLFVVHLLVLS